jgi:response regulator RpfG family c-di-GMP phosphodiesterase
MSVTTCPQFTDLDPEILQDFSECLQENIDQIELCLGLLDSAFEPDLIHRLFRDVHSLKGNCRMVFLEPLVDTIHSLEEIVSDIRQGNKTYNRLYGEFFAAIVARINQMILGFIHDGQVKGEPHILMSQVIENVRSSPSNETDKTINEALDALASSQETQQAETPLTHTSVEVTQDSSDKETETHPDLIFFRSLALQLDELNIYKTGRTQTILDLCISTNEDLDNLVDKEQLTAAVYLHDLGMSLIPSEILNKPSKLSNNEFQLIKNHVDMGSQFLQRIPGWEEAAIMVSQHHEKFNGSGYPLGLSQNDIHPGAMMIALADTFYAVTNERADRSYKKSLFSAVTLINGESGSQFNPRHIEAFNETVRRHYIAPKSA